MNQKRSNRNRSITVSADKSDGWVDLRCPPDRF